MRLLKTLLKKEFRQFRRNAFLPRLCIVFPIMVMLVMPLVATMDVKNVRIAVVDLDSQHFSRQLMQKIEASEYMELSAVCHSYDAALKMVEDDKADVIIEIPYGYEKGGKKLNVSANAVNGTKGQLGIQYVVQIISEGRKVESEGQTYSVRYLYNETLNYRHFMIPALTAMLVIMLCGFLPALNLVGEKELGTIEQINVTPGPPALCTLGKLMPYWIIGLLVLTVSVVLAWLVYDFPIAGSAATLYLAAALFILFMSGIGVAIANKSQTMQQTMFVMFFFVVLFILMSGLMTPVQSMPHWAQCITYAIPPRNFIDIMRASWLRAASVFDLWFEFLSLLTFAIISNAAAILTFRKQQ